MGFINTPVTYQNRMVRYILGWKKDGKETDGVFLSEDAGALLWIDDILVYANSWKGFMDVLSRILSRLQKYKVRLNISKCCLISGEVT